MKRKATQIATAVINQTEVWLMWGHCRHDRRNCPYTNLRVSRENLLFLSICLLIGDLKYTLRELPCIVYVWTDYELLNGCISEKTLPFLSSFTRYNELFPKSPNTDHRRLSRSDE